MAESYKLSYFPIKGAAEPIRLIFAHAGVQYEDIRIPKEDWPNVKKDYPYGQLPVLQVGDKVLAQSNAICRFLGRKYNLHGTNDWEAAKIDEAADALGDFKKEFSPVFREEDPAKKAVLKQNFIEVAVPKYFGKFDSMVASNGGHIVGKQLSWVDLSLAHILESYGAIMPEHANLLDGYPNLKKLKETVYAIPSIKAWVDKRPQTPM